MKSKLVSRKMITLFLFVAVLLFLKNAEAKRDIPDNNLAYPALIIIDEHFSGSGFFYRSGSCLYFITARHVLFNAIFSVELEKLPSKFKFPDHLKHRIFFNKGKKQLLFVGVMNTKEKQELLKLSQDEIYFNNAIEKLFKLSQRIKLKGMTATIISYSDKKDEPNVNEFQLNLEAFFRVDKILYHPSYDIAAIRIGRIITKNGIRKIKIGKEIQPKSYSKIVCAREESIKKFDNVLVGNEVFIFGYPTSLSISPHIGIKKPLLRKGIVAGKNKFLKTIILDCPAYPGNSGGLVIEIERIGVANYNLSPIGIVSEYVPFYKKVTQNSGYSIVVPMDAVNELISK